LGAADMPIGCALIFVSSFRIAAQRRVRNP
jgi:hypothetical protein